MQNTQQSSQPTDEHTPKIKKTQWLNSWSTWWISVKCTLHADFDLIASVASIPPPNGTERVNLIVNARATNQPLMWYSITGCVRFVRMPLQSSWAYKFPFFFSVRLMVRVAVVVAWCGCCHHRRSCFMIFSCSHEPKNPNTFSFRCWRNDATALRVHVRAAPSNKWSDCEWLGVYKRYLLIHTGELMYNGEFDCRAETWDHRRQDECYLFSYLFYFLFISSSIPAVCAFMANTHKKHAHKQLMCSPHNHVADTNPAVPWYG